MYKKSHSPVHGTYTEKMFESFSNNKFRLSFSSHKIDQNNISKEFKSQNKIIWNQKIEFLYKYAWKTESKWAILKKSRLESNS